MGEEEKKTALDKSRGFSLIEIIVTLVVVSIAAVGVLSVFSVGLRGSADPLILAQAAGLAQEKMDSIMGDKMNPTRGFAWIAPVNYPAENPVAGFPAFSRTVNIFCVASAALNTSTGAPPCAGGYAHVRVTVSHAALADTVIDGLVTNY
jgi:prepilin-type N-terminal cleavage/methylation domain-containing protein